MKILVATHYYPEHVGGIESISDNLTRRLCARGHEIHWCALGSSSAGQSTVRRIPLRGYNFCEDFLGFPWPVITPTSLARILRIARDFDLIHLHDTLYMSCAAAALAARISHIPLLVTQHIDLVPYSNPLLRWGMQLANRTLGHLILSKADQVIFYSSRAKNYFERFVTFKRTPEFIPNGVDHELFPAFDTGQRLEARRELGFPAVSPLLIFVGRFTEKKGLHLLRKVSASMPECSFAFAGHGTEDPARWALPNVKSLGILRPDQLRTLYNAADLLLLPSTGEGLPVAAQEALSCGTPCLLSSETGRLLNLPKEILLTADRTADEIVAAIKDYLSNSGAHEKIRSACRMHAEKHWSWEKCVDSYEKTMQRLIQKAGH